MRGSVIAIALILIVTLGAPNGRAQSRAALAPPHSDAGVDLEGNGLFNLLVVSVSLNVMVPGFFTIQVYLADSAGLTAITYGEVTSSLPVGPTSVPVGLSGADIYYSGVSGSYNASIYVYDDSGRNLLDRGNHTTNGYLYTMFQPPGVKFAPPHSDAGIDADGDNLFDVLRVYVVVDVVAVGTYFLGVTAQSSSWIAGASVPFSPPIGPGQTIAVDLTGWRFRASGANGPYDVMLTLDGGFGVLDIGNHSTAAYRATDFELPPSSLKPPHADRGVDTDGDGLFNAIEVNVSLQIDVAADYHVQVWFYDDPFGSTSLGGKRSSLQLGAGPQVASLRVSTLDMVIAGIPGPYTVRIDLASANDMPIDSGTHTTLAYNPSQFDPIPARFASPHADMGVDRDEPPDGRYNMLRVNASLIVDEGGPYEVSAYLWDAGMTIGITGASKHATLPAGPQVISVDFPGVYIRMSGIDGPYAVSLSLLAGALLPIDTDVHMTGLYRAEDFPSVTPSVLTGVVTDSVTSMRIPFATVAAHDYANGLDRGTIADSLGSYALPLYEGDWVVTFDDFLHNASLASLTVGAATTLNVSLEPSVPDPMVETRTLESWNRLTLQSTGFLQNDVVAFRQFLDLYYGDRDQYLSQAEWDGFLALGGTFPSPLTAPPSNSTWETLLTDWVWYDFVLGSDAGAFHDAAGPIDSPIPLRATQTAAYENETVAVSPTHTVRARADFDTPFENRSITLILPAGYLLASFSLESPGVTVTGIGAGTVVIDAGPDPDLSDGFDHSWITLTVATSDSSNPTIVSAGAAPDPVPLGDAVTISATATDDTGVVSMWLRAWNASGGLAVDTRMTDRGFGNYDQAFVPDTLGAWSFTITAMDFAGNSASESRMFDVQDLRPPTILATSATPDPQEYGQPVRFVATVSDEDAVGSVTLEIRDAAGTLAGNFTMGFNAASGGWEYSTASLALGTNTYRVWARDASYNWESAAGTITIRDTTPPALTGASAIPDTVEVGSATTISVTAEDLAEVASVKLAVRDPNDLVVGTWAMTPLSGGTYAHAFTPMLVGDYTFTVTATDVGGNPSTTSGGFTSQDTTNPVAHAGPDRNVAAGATVTFDGSASTDNVGIINWTWEFTEDTVAVRVYGPASTHTFNIAGTYVVTLIVEDVAGNADTDTVTITVIVDTINPVASAGADQTVEAGATVTFDGSASTDNDGIANFTWRLAQGASPITLYGSSPIHRFDIAGNYVVTLTVRDSAGNADTDIVTITVRSRDATNPVANAGPDQTVEAGATLTLNGGGSSDDVEIANYTWEFRESGETVRLYGSAPRHTFRTEGTYVVTLTVRDLAGNTGTDTVTITVKGSRGEVGGLPTWVWALLLVIFSGILAAVVAAVLFLSANKSKRRAVSSDTMTAESGAQQAKEEATGPGSPPHK